MRTIAWRAAPSSIDVYSRKQFGMLAPASEACVISCQSPPTSWGEGTLSEIPTGWGDSLVLEFHDVLQQSSPEVVVFDAKMADRVVTFVEGCLGSRFVIHCDAGQSRSVAIGLWLSQYSVDLDAKEEQHPLYLHAAPHAGSYNSTVLNELRRAENRYWYGEDYTFPEEE